MLIDLSQSDDDNLQKIIKWVDGEKIKIMNIAGPRESQSPGIYDSSFNFLSKVFEHIYKLTFRAKL